MNHTQNVVLNSNLGLAHVLAVSLPAACPLQFVTAYFHHATQAQLFPDLDLPVLYMDLDVDP